MRSGRAQQGQVGFILGGEGHVGSAHHGGGHSGRHRVLVMHSVMHFDASHHGQGGSDLR